MRFPAFVLDHPVEALVAGVLLVALVFGSADRHAVEVDKASQNGQAVSAAKL